MEFLGIVNLWSLRAYVDRMDDAGDPKVRGWQWSCSCQGLVEDPVGCIGNTVRSQDFATLDGKQNEEQDEDEGKLSTEGVNCGKIGMGKMIFPNPLSSLRIIFY